MSGLLSGYFSNWKHSNKLATYVNQQRVILRKWMNCGSKIFLSQVASQGNF